MIKLYQDGVYLYRGEELFDDPRQCQQATGCAVTPEEAAEATISYGILTAHNTGDDMSALRLKFDSMTSHDITSVGIIQTARASGMTHFPVPYVLTNCHNSLCAVGGTINEDDHKFALSAARKYGGIYVPTNLANIHSYNRETMAVCGGMILGSDSHTRYGALGTMAVGEGGGELVKQLLGRTYDMRRPQVVAVYLTGTPRPGVGPHDVALTIVAAVYKSGYVKNKVMEFVGPGVAGLSMEYRNAIDVMTTETTCWSSVWVTDDKTRDYYQRRGRGDRYRRLAPGEVAYYDGCVYVDLSEVECSIAMPMHPSNVYTIRTLQENAADILALTEKEMNEQIVGARIDLRSKLRDGSIWVEQGEIAGCFGAGDCPANGAFSVRHTTRNFPNREGSKPGEGQLSAVALMDARSIAATAAHQGRLTAATEMDVTYRSYEDRYNDDVYRHRVYNGWGRAQQDEALHFGPNIKEWPELPAMSKDMLLRICAYITTPVTTTDELIPSGETSSYRSNPERLSDFALGRCVPEYVERSKAVRQADRHRRTTGVLDKAYSAVYDALYQAGVTCDPAHTNIGSTIYANMPGDGSAREQAASSQRIVGASANLAKKYATKRYRSNCINWGMVPFLVEDPADFALFDYVFVPDIRRHILEGTPSFPAYVVTPEGVVREVSLSVGELTVPERETLISGCLINYYRNH